jgi:hypothetical protein
LPEGKLVSGYFFLVFFAGFFFAGMAFLRIGLDFLARFVAFLLTGIGPPLGWDAAGQAPFLMAGAFLPPFASDYRNLLFETQGVRIKI